MKETISPRRERPTDGKRKLSMQAHPMLLSHIPTRGQSQQQWAWNITNDLVQLCLPKLSIADTCLLIHAANSCFCVDQQTDCFRWVSTHAWAAFDELLMQQAAVTGWRLSLSPLVQSRFAKWEREVGGVKRFRAYNAACELAMERFRGEAKMPWDPALYAHRTETVKELSHLLGMLRKELAAHGSVAEIETKLANVFLEAVARQKRFYKRLHCDWDAWCLFFAHQPHRTLLRTCVARSQAALLYDTFVAWPRGIQPESAAQAISRLKP